MVNDELAVTMKFQQIFVYNRRPLLARILVFIFIPALVFSLVYLNKYRSASELSDPVLEVKGLKQEVKLNISSWGVPEIVAQSERDAFFVLGYLHAKDRLWQMEIQKRLVRGTLSEVFGIGELQTDKYMRTLGLESAADKALNHLSFEAKDALEAYAEGVNQWMSNSGSLPLEFDVFNIQSTPWTASLSVAVGKLFALNLSQSKDFEALKLIASQMMTSETYQALYGSKYAPATKMNEESNGPFSDFFDIESQYALGGKNVGSNAWVVSGKHTRSGAAILANDPHLTLEIPSVWYAAKIKTPDFNIEGMSIVGLPAIIFGSNDHIAWGGTHLPADVQDLVVLETNLSGDAYLLDGEWQTFKTTSEEISISPGLSRRYSRKIKPSIFQRNAAHLGPVVSQFLGLSNNKFALRWTALDEADTSYEAFYRLQHAGNWDEFREAASFLVAPTLNLLYADKANNIGMTTAGKIPIRPPHMTSDFPTLLIDFEWQGYIPWQEMPFVYNPESGYLSSANQQNFPSDFPYFISNEWASDTRNNRIQELLENKIASSTDAIDISFFQRMQADVVDNFAPVFIAQVFSGSAFEDEWLQPVLGWTGDFSEDSNAPVVYMYLLKNLRLALLLDEFLQLNNSPSDVAMATRIINSFHSEQILEAWQQGQWCDNQNTPQATETCAELLVAQLQNTREELDKLTSGDITDLRWSGTATKAYVNKVFSGHQATEFLFKKNALVGGSLNTVNVGGYIYDKFEGFQQVLGPTFRQVIEMTPEKSHLSILATGQSGNVFRDEYDNMLEPFDANRLLGSIQPEGRTYSLLPKVISHSNKDNR